MMRRRVAAVAGLALATTGLTPAWAGPEAARAVVEETLRTSGFDGVVLVDRSGETELFEAHGLADRAFGVPVALDTRFKVASITKLFTAVLTVQLAEAGLLSLEGRVVDYLPDYSGDPSITIESLLNHTSGLPNPDNRGLDQVLAEGYPMFQRPYTRTALVELYASGPLVAPVGTQFDYNNADYLVLGRVIEAVTGQPFEAVLAERILTPLALQDTGLLRQEDIVPRLAPSYFRIGDGAPLRNDLPVYPENWFAAGALYSDADDLMAFLRALYGGRLVSAAGLARMLEPGLDDHGYGQWIWDVSLNGQARTVAVRFGQIMGANSVAYHVIEDDLTVVVLSNTTAVDMGQFARRLAAASLE